MKIIISWSQLSMTGVFLGNILVEKQVRKFRAFVEALLYRLMMGMGMVLEAAGKRIMVHLRQELVLSAITCENVPKALPSLSHSMTPLSVSQVVRRTVFSDACVFEQPASFLIILCLP